ncbi:MAG: AarF/ABC1/UbiB kinase family protein [Nitrospiraceae bacterium]|nr:AarF/ABC1/UbiB kinase family protein [Nitrospiraceae bacterium]
MFFNVKRQTHHGKRYREIAGALSRHGLGWLALELNFGMFIPFHWGLLGHPKRKKPYTQAEHIRMALEDMGTTFIKMGQILSTRPDLMPPDYIEQFSKLQDSVPPFPYDQAAEVIGREFGAPPEEIFKSFSREPLASASIGQVHAAVLRDDTPVVVKVQRPGVEELVEEDLDIISHAARYAALRSEFGSRYDIEGWVDEFAFTLRSELDYTREGRNAERIRGNFADDKRIYVPRIYWELTSKRVLTMEKVSGIKITDFESIDKAGYNRRRIAENAAHVALTMTYDHGFFHADPHPGNFFVLPHEVIGLIDYGMVGRLDDALRQAILRLFLALTHQDANRLAEEFMALGFARGPLRRHSLKRDLDHFIQQFYDKPLKDVVSSKGYNELFAIAYRHRLQLPSDLIMLFKVIAMSEGLGAQLDPEFRLLEFAGPYFERFWLKGHSLGAQTKRIVEGTRELTALGLDLPAYVRRMMGRIERGEMTSVTRLEGWEETLREVRRATNRISASILTASLVIGLGLLMLIYHPPGWKEYGGWIFGLLFVLVCLFGLGLLWRIRRPGRKE